MLSFHDFQLPQKPLNYFKFDKLVMVNGADLGATTYTNSLGHEFKLFEIDSIDQAKIYDSLSKSGVILNYKGCLKKENRYFGFYSVSQFFDLHRLGEKLTVNHERHRIDQRFCIEYFQTFVYILSQVQKCNTFIKILHPSNIGIRSADIKQNIGFGLLLPLNCKFFSCILRQEYNINIKYAAPQVIRYFQQNPVEEICQKQFRKASLFSIGLILLFCFGYEFSPSSRIEASRNNKQFRLIFKKYRKEIKDMHGGKFVPKVLKLLLEDCEKSRQILETWSIKMHSDQFQSLKICKNFVPNTTLYIPTLSQSTKSQLDKSKKTINLEINSPLTLTPLSKINQISPKPTNQQIESPINIEVSFEDDIMQKPRLLPEIREEDQNTKRIRSKQIKDDEQQIRQKEFKENDRLQEQDYEKREIYVIKNQQAQFQSYSNIIEEKQVYRYNVDQVLNKNKSELYKLNGGRKDPNITEDLQYIQIQQGQVQDFDEKSILRKKLDQQSKIIMAVIMLSFFVYGVIGYIKQNMSN